MRFRLFPLMLFGILSRLVDIEALRADSPATELAAASDFRRALAQSRDPILLMLRQSRPVLRSQWESSFAEAAVLVGTASRAPP